MPSRHSITLIDELASSPPAGLPTAVAVAPNERHNAGPMQFEWAVSTLSAIRSQYAMLSVEAWLTDAERGELAHWRNPRRREAWLAGRWLAKRLLLPESEADRRQAVILSLNAERRSQRPQVQVAARNRTGCLSISHYEDVVLAAVSREPRWIGCDVQAHCSLDRRFAETWFTAGERDWVNAQRDPAAASVRVWALKEAVYKAVNRGESFAPKRVEVALTDTQAHCISHPTVRCLLLDAGEHVDRLAENEHATQDTNAHRPRASLVAAFCLDPNRRT